LLVDRDELDDLQELASDGGRRRSLDYAPLALHLRELEKRQMAFPSLERAPVSQTRFLTQFPEGDMVVALSQFVTIRSIDNEQILVVNYVNGRSVCRPGGDRSLIEELARGPMTVLGSMEPVRHKLEKLRRFGIVNIQERNKPRIKRIERIQSV